MDLDPNCITKKEWGNIYQKSDAPTLITADKLTVNKNADDNTKGIDVGTNNLTNKKQNENIATKKSAKIKKTKKGKPTQKKKLQKKNKSK